MRVAGAARRAAVEPAPARSERAARVRRPTTRCARRGSAPAASRRVERRRDRRHQHRLLGVGRAAEAARAEVPAALHVALDRGRRMPSFSAPRRSRSLFSFGAASQGPIDQPPLGLGEPGRHRRLGQFGEAVALAPDRQGRRRGAERAGPVDGGRAADAAALQDRDRLVGGLARRGLLVQRRIGLALALAEVARERSGPSSTITTDKPGTGQPFGRDAGAGAAADDRDVAASCPAAPCGPPWTRQPRARPSRIGSGRARHAQTRHRARVAERRPGRSASTYQAALVRSRSAW